MWLSQKRHVIEKNSLYFQNQRPQISQNHYFVRYVTKKFLFVDQCLLWTPKFVDLRNLLETIEKKQINILTCWESLPENVSCLKKMAIALLSAFGSTYLCEQIFSHMKFILSAHRSRLTEDHSESCVQLKASKFSLNITELIKEKQGQGSH